MATAAKNQVSKIEHHSSALATSDVPEYLRNKGPARGSEDVGSDDMIIPRLELVQGLSPCLDESNSAYIDGAKIGQLYNNVTREVYGKSIEVIPVFWKKEFIVWKSRKSGGGFVGAFTTMEAAEVARAAQEKPDDHQVNDTVNQFCLLRNPTSGRLEQIVISMAITKLKISRQWQSLIRLNEGDSFSRVYTLGTAVEKNKIGEPYQNYTIKSGGYVTEAEFNQAEALYELVKSGMAVADRSMEASGKTDNGSSEY